MLETEPSPGFGSRLLRQTITRELAGQLDLRDDQKRLHESLEEEKQTDALLTRLAKGEVNADALAA